MKLFGKMAQLGSNVSLVLLAQMAACGQIRPPAPPVRFSETVLGKYQKDASGAFSPHWVAYLVDPAKDAADKSESVDLNGKRLGPYSQVSRKMVLSGDGRHIAFAAEKAGKWVVVVDGVEKYTHEGLVWPEYTWTSSLEGSSTQMQTRAASLMFSPNGQVIAYPAKTSDGKYAMFVNGKPGGSYSDIGSRFSFVGDHVKYYAFQDDKKLMEVDGTRVLGPYDKSYRTRFSADGKHYILWATRGEKSVLVVDGRESDLPGEVVDYVVGNDGFSAYAYKTSGGYRVRRGGEDVPGEFEQVTQMTASPDSKKVAFWAKRDGKWVVRAGEKEFPGFDGYFYYQAGGMTYSLMWSPDSQHVAYYVRRGGFVLDGQDLGNKFHPSGLGFQSIVDDSRDTVGLGLLNGPNVETEALVQSALLRDKTTCDPFSVSLVGQALACVEKKDKGTYMRVGERVEGPFNGIRSVLFTKAGGKHYAYIVETEKGQQVVVDGVLSEHAYAAIYRPVLDEERSIEFVAIKEGNLVGVVQPFVSK